MRNIFGRGHDEKDDKTYFFKEPTLDPPKIGASEPHRFTSSLKENESAGGKQAKEIEVPMDFAGITAYFQKKVTDRKSPYNALVQSADRLQEFIPDEISRLRAAFAICGHQWSPEILSLAITTHMADIDLALDRAKNSKGNKANDRAETLRQQAEQIQARNARLQEEIDGLNNSIRQLQERIDANNTEIATINQQLHLTEADVNSINFLDQAANNLKNDLLAKKTLLGLP